MKPDAHHRNARATATGRLVLAVGWLSLLPLLSGCLVVGYSRPGGWFMFPGLGVLLLIIVLVLLLRR